MPKVKRSTSTAKTKSPRLGKKARPKTKKKVSAIPKGYHSITPYLIVDNAEKAIGFYKKAFSAKEVIRMEKPDGRIGHAELKIGDAKIMLADAFPEMDAHSPNYYKGSPVCIHLYIKNVDTIAKQAVATGATLIRPIENMFYGDRSGTIVDPFGHKWHLSTHIKDVTKSQLKKRAVAFTKKQ